MPSGFSTNMAESAHDALHARAMLVVGGLGTRPDVLDEAKDIASKRTGHSTNAFSAG